MTPFDVIKAGDFGEEIIKLDGDAKEISDSLTVMPGILVELNGILDQISPNVDLIVLLASPRCNRVPGSNSSSAPGSKCCTTPICSGAIIEMVTTTAEGKRDVET